MRRVLRLRRATPPLLVPLQDGAQDGCADSGDAGGGRLKPQLNEEQLKSLLTQGQAAQAKVRSRQGGARQAGRFSRGAVAGMRSVRHVSRTCACQIALQVLRFTGGVERLFGGWADAAAAERFKRRLDQYGAIWCCVDVRPAGHVWYDFFHDTPHTDRHGRAVGGKWEPLTGP